MSVLTGGEVIEGLTVDGRAVRAAVVDDRRARAAAGITMAIGAIAFAYAYFDRQYVPLQLASAFFFVEFLVRVTAGLRRSPVGLVAGVMIRRGGAEWVSAKPKRFAWTLGLALSGAMAVITNSGIRGWLPRTVCLLCLTLMWLESVLGLCLGCEIHALLVRRGWTRRDDAVEICAGGACDVAAEGGT